MDTATSDSAPDDALAAAFTELADRYLAVTAELFDDDPDLRIDR